MCNANGPTPEVFAVLRVLDHARDFDPSGLGRFIAGDYAHHYGSWHGSNSLAGLFARLFLVSVSTVLFTWKYAKRLIIQCLIVFIRRLLGFGSHLSLTLYGFDSRNQPAILPQLAGRVETFGLCLYSSPEERFARIFQRKLQLLVAHLAKFFGCIHRYVLPLPAYIGRRLSKRTLTGILCASRAKQIRAASSEMPPISYNTVPGRTTAAQ